MLEYAAFPIFDHSLLVLCFLIDASGGKSMKPSQQQCCSDCDARVNPRATAVNTQVLLQWVWVGSEILHF